MFKKSAFEVNRKHLFGALSILIVAAAAAVTSAAVFRPRISNPSSVVLPPAQDLEIGRAVYTEYCDICHGVEGDGNGPGAANMDPRPRDFRRGWYEIRTTASGQLPTDEDLQRIIAVGMPGTTMPAWQGKLSEQEIQAVTQYIKSFSRRFERETPTRVELGQKVASSQDSIARGREIYQGAEAECVKCHGNAGRGDGPSADELTEDAFGDVIVPADLTMPWLFRGGPTVEEIAMRLKTGLTGGPMPAYADVLSDEDIWHLANYVDSLGADAPPEYQPAIIASFVQGALPDDSGAAAWQETAEYYYPFLGQIMVGERNFTPSISGVWVRALYNDQELALQLRWHDRVQDAGEGQNPSDGFAVQFPAELSDSDDNPYFVLGDPSHAVNLWVWDASTNAIEERTARGAGTEQTQTGQDIQGSAAYTDGEYILIVHRNLRNTVAEDIQFELGRFIPIAFIAWDGWQTEQIGSGAISSWFQIYLDRPVTATTYLWIPAAIIVTALLETWAVWGARRQARKREN